MGFVTTETSKLSPNTFFDKKKSLRTFPIELIKIYKMTLFQMFE